MTEDDPMRSALESIRGENPEETETNSTKQTTAPSNTSVTDETTNKPKSEVKKRTRSASEKRKIGGVCSCSIMRTTQV